MSAWLCTVNFSSTCQIALPDAGFLFIQASYLSGTTPNNTLGLCVLLAWMSAVRKRASEVNWGQQTKVNSGHNVFQGHFNVMTRVPWVDMQMLVLLQPPVHVTCGHASRIIQTCIYCNGCFSFFSGVVQCVHGSCDGRYAELQQVRHPTSWTRSAACHV